MPSLDRFSARTIQWQYGLLTLVFAAVLIAAGLPSGAPFTQLVTSPWLVMGQALDRSVRIDTGARMLDIGLSILIVVPIFWAYCALTSRRIRDIGQSGWWTLLVVFGGLTVPAMIVLSLLRPRGTPDEERGTIEGAGPQIAH